MASQTDIVNLALYYLAQSIVIPTMVDESKAADIANRLWEPTLDQILAERPWSWAIKAQALAVDIQDPMPGWAYRYSYPDDCIRMWAITNVGGLEQQPFLSWWCCVDQWPAWWRQLYAWNKSYGDQGTTIDSNLREAWGVFVVRVSDTNRFPPMFVEAFARLLAKLMAPPLIGDVGLNAQQGLQNAYIYALQVASSFDGNESQEGMEPLTPSLAARGC